jgi:hypothetical protein
MDRCALESSTKKTRDRNRNIENSEFIYDEFCTQKYIWGEIYAGKLGGKYIIMNICSAVQ